MEYYCAYQERCYKEVEGKLYSFSVNLSEKEEILTYLIENNFINEERFAQSFVRGKHNYKFWGKNRIVNELKFRNISSRIITIALKEIPEETYIENFHQKMSATDCILCSPMTMPTFRMFLKTMVQVLP